MTGYDANGNATSGQTTTHLGVAASPWRDGTFTSRTTYDELGRPLATTLPYDSGQFAETTTLAYSYDDRGLPREVRTAGAALLSIPEYTAAGSLVRATYRNGVTDRWTYEPLTLRLSSSVTRQPSGAAILSYGYQYDANNNPTTITRTDGPQPLGLSAITKTYGYDSLDRLEWARYAGVETEPLRYGYSYSPAGNILVKDDAFYHYEGEDPQAVTGRMSFIKGGAESYGYDRDGNLTYASTPVQSWSYTWDGEGRLAYAVPAEGAAATFRYGPQGERLLKRAESDGGGYADLYLGTLELRGSDAKDGGQLAGYYNVSLGAVTAQLALRRDVNGRLVRDPAADRTYHKDHLGSTALVTASDGSVTSETGDAGRLEYAPYGEELLTDAGARRIHIRYTGKETDDETGLTYYGARYAHAGLGRWVSRDPLAVGNPLTTLRDGQDANLYALVAHKPTKFTDPDGLCPNCCFGKPCTAVKAETEQKYAFVLHGKAVGDGYQLAADVASIADQTPLTNLISAGISVLRGDMEGAKLSLSAAVLTITAIGDELIEGKKVYQAIDALETAGDASRVLATGAEGAKVVNAFVKGADEVAAGGAPKRGIYEFADQTAGGKPYVGQSGDLPKRLGQHEQAGRLAPGTQRTTTVDGGKTAREVAEHQRIQELTGGVPARQSPDVANKVDPIGPKRQHLLKKE